jgi:hypothetical protein
MQSPTVTEFAGLALLLLMVLAPATATAQEPPPRPIVAASGRVATSVAFDGRLVGRQWLNRSTAHSGPALLVVDYGQPHARGRLIYGGLVPFGQVWRLGANMSTHLRADLNVQIGALRIPQGLYTLYLLPHAEGADLIVNRSTGQWGTEYYPSDDLGRVPMRARVLPEPVESLAITLSPTFPPADGELPTGTLTIAWGTIEYAVDWRVTWP